MSSNEERITLALRDLESLRTREEAEAREHEQEIYHLIPRIREIDEELHAVAPNAISYYLRSKDRDKTKLLEALKGSNQSLRKEKENLLMEHGFPKDYTKVRYQCPVCKDQGYVDGKRCRCLDQRLIRMAYDQSNLGETMKHQHFGVFDFSRFSDKPFKHYQKTPRENIEIIFDQMFRFAEDYPNVSPMNLYFLGSAGTGKTFMCSCLAKAFMDRGFSVLYLSADDLCMTLERNRFVSRDNGDTQGQVDLIQNVDLLIIDDLGTEVRTSLSSNLLLNCINQRLITQHSTIISSNLVLSGITENYSERMTSRISGAYQILEFYGPDLRQQ